MDGYRRSSSARERRRVCSATRARPRNSDCIAEADGSLMFPEVLRPAPGEGIRTWLMIPHVGKVLLRAPVGKCKDVEEAQKLPVNPSVKFSFVNY